MRLDEDYYIVKRSENSFFSYSLVPGQTFKFMLCYESAMERQRHTQEKLDHQSFDSFPALLTLLPIEVHAPNVYTRSLFIRVQKEIVLQSLVVVPGGSDHVVGGLRDGTSGSVSV
ncbi:hypothetical protein Tco_1103975 [Tanacetum coccineum]